MFSSAVQSFIPEPYKPTVKNIVRRIRAILNYLSRYIQFVVGMTVLSIGQVFLMRPIWNAHEQMLQAHNKILAMTDAENLLFTRMFLGSGLSIVLLYLASQWLWTELDLDVKKAPDVVPAE